MVNLNVPMGAPGVSAVKSSLDVDKKVYFHTHVARDDVIVVIEIVSVSKGLLFHY